MAFLFQGARWQKKKPEEGEKNPLSVSSPRVRAGGGREAVLPPPPPNGANHSQLVFLALSLCLPLSLLLLLSPPLVCKVLRCSELVGNAYFSAFPHVLQSNYLKICSRKWFY